MTDAEIAGAKRALDAMAERGIGLTSDLLALQADVAEAEAERARGASAAGGLEPRRFALDVLDFFVTMPRELAERPALRVLARENRLRTAGLLLLLLVVAAGILRLPW